VKKLRCGCVCCISTSVVLLFLFFFPLTKTKKPKKLKNSKTQKHFSRIVDSQLSQWTQAAALAFSLVAPDAFALAPYSHASSKATEMAIDACLWVSLAFLGAVSVLGGLCRRKSAAGSTGLEIVLQLASSAAVA